MMFVYLGIILGCWYLGYSMGKATEQQKAKNEQQQQILFAEQLDIERKKTADETKKQLKFESDTRIKVRKRIEQEERDSK